MVYYFQAPERLILQPALRRLNATALRRLGYYCARLTAYLRQKSRRHRAPAKRIIHARHWHPYGSRAPRITHAVNFR